MGDNFTMRLPKPKGLYLDRSKTITFVFAGKHYQGLQGDSIASALAANNERLLSRSFKYHRPRGILTMAGRDANTLVQVEDEPNVRADTYAITEGLEVFAQNVYGSLENDWGRFIEHIGRFLPVGFYYKAFYKPKGIWKYWDTIIRNFAGLGKVDVNATPYASDKAYRFCDVVVIGGGPAGLSAALQAANAGAEVILVDENQLLGGSLNYVRFNSNNSQTLLTREKLVNAVTNHPAINIYTNAMCTGWFADNWLAIMCEQRMLKLRSQVVVAATGSIEQPAIFRNNDLPGVMLGSAAQRLINLYGVAPGKLAVVLTGNDDGYGVALDLIDSGIEVQAIVEMRTTPSHSSLAAAINAKNIRILQGYTVYEAIPGAGKRSITHAVIHQISSEGTVNENSHKIACDLICMSAGYTPAAQLLCHSGGQLKYDEADAILKVTQLPAHGQSVAAGSLNSVFEIDAVLADGKYAGWLAATNAGFPNNEPANVPHHVGAQGQNYPWPIFPHPKGRDFIDVDEDLQVKDIVNAVKDGYDDLELVKRYSTVVMGPSQGRQSALNNMRLVTKEANRSLNGITITTQRPPYSPEYIQHLAGKAFQPVKHTAIHYRHLECNAQMMSAGLWLRPAYYGNPENKDTCIEKENLAVRNNVGIVDVSTLGKLEIRGPDAAEFLNRMYTFAYAKQLIHRSRYVLMTDSTGAIIDDGVACRLDEHHFYVTATTGGVDGVYRNMLRWNTEWNLNLDIANVTAAYAAVNLAGPNSRDVLSCLTDDIELSAQQFSYMEVRTGHIAKIPARILRVGFVGELGYEIHVPANQGEALWDALMKTGEEFEIRPFGVEAQRLLRLEKGHIIVNQDTDGLTIPQETNMGWAIAQKKPFYMGKRAIDVMSARSLDRLLVGFTMPSDAPLPEECNLVVNNNEITGRVTSVAYSPTLKSIIGLAFVSPDQSEIGKQFNIKLSNSAIVKATVCPTPFYDPENKRQEM